MVPGVLYVLYLSKDDKTSLYNSKKVIVHHHLSEIRRLSCMCLTSYHDYLFGDACHESKDLLKKSLYLTFGEESIII